MQGEPQALVGESEPLQRELWEALADGQKRAGPFAVLVCQLNQPRRLRPVSEDRDLPVAGRVEL